MEKFSATGLLARTAARSLSPTVASRTIFTSYRAFSQTSARRADGDIAPPPPPTSPSRASSQFSQPSSSPIPRANAMENLIPSMRTIGANPNAAIAQFARASVDTSALYDQDDAASLKKGLDDSITPYHFNVYATKHNTHVTVSKPNREVIISMSSGQLGFRKSNRKHYDSAYQLGVYVLDKMHSTNLVNTINKIEVVLNGFGPGREALVKILLGTEGRKLRDKVRSVSDSTKLKFGGTRSPKPRRLG